MRREAAQTYIYLVRDGCLSRDEAVECLSKHLRTAVRRNDSEIAGALVAELTNFAPEEALEDITEAFDRELVDIGLVGMESVQKSIAEGEARVQRALQHCGPTGIEDTIAELQHWAAFEEKPAPPRTPQAPRPHFVKPCEPIASAPATVTSRRQHVGRNDPCPCGSGKKYKKCCGRRM